MEENFDRTRHSLPFFFNIVGGESGTARGWVGVEAGNAPWPVFSIAHVPGRWLNALLAAEAVGLYQPAPSTIATLREWTMLAFGGPVALPRNIDTESLQPLPSVELHNVREGLHALYALIHFRDDTAARELALACIAVVETYFQDGVWRHAQFEADSGLDGTAGADWTPARFTLTLGRAIGPLVKLARDCDIPEAGALAERLGRYAVENVYLADGSFDLARHGAHIHSVTSVLSSLAQLADFTGDAELMDRVEAFVEHGLPVVSLDFGWSVEILGSGRYVGEGNNTVDIVETLLILARRDPRYFERVERILRSHLLPSQLIDVGFISDELTGDNGLRKLANRSLGTFGFPLPYGHEESPGGVIAFNWDIVGGVVAGLCEVVRAQVTISDDQAEVDLLLDSSTALLSVRGPYDGAETVIIDAGPVIDRVLVRLPSWSDRAVLGAWAKMHGHDLGATQLNLLTHERKRVEFPMPLPTIRREYRFEELEFVADYLGDQIVSMSAPGKRLRFFEQLGR